jgi:hypothetical protein
VTRIFIGLLLFVVLTLVTQVGGLFLILAWVIARFAFPQSLQGWRRSASVTALFLGLYAALSILVVPAWAALGGRVPLPCHAAADRPFAPPIRSIAHSIATTSTSASSRS